MILFTNGDSNTAAGEAVNDYCFAEDDPKLWRLGRSPHPDNLAVSWGQKLAEKLGANHACFAESASSNKRIMRTTETYLLENEYPDLVVIGWSTWERTEWLYDGTYYQINAGGVGHDWPEPIKNMYKPWLASIDYQQRMDNEHSAIYYTHNLLKERGITHYFFNCYEPFSGVREKNWDGCYLGPYDRNLTYFNWCKAQGFKPTKPNGYHYGADAHAAWADFLYTQIVQSLLTRK